VFGQMFVRIKEKLESVLTKQRWGHGFNR